MNKKRRELFESLMIYVRRIDYFYNLRFYNINEIIISILNRSPLTKILKEFILYKLSLSLICGFLKIVIINSRFVLK